MLLAVDVGNTDISFGIFEGEKLTTKFRFTVKVPRTSDEYGELLCNILELANVTSPVVILEHGACALIQ